MRARILIFMSVVLLLASWSAGRAAAEDGLTPRIGVGTIIKAVHTHRDRSDKTGVEGISVGTLRWVELDFTADAGEEARFRIDLVAAQNIHPDPITGIGTSPRGGYNEMGEVGIRRAEIELRELLPYTSLTVGVFIPQWGVFQRKSAADWEFVDLPLIYTSPAFRGLGWQNTGLSMAVTPIDQLEISLFWINGYFPNGLANNEPALPNGEFDREKGLGGRLLFRLGPASLFGGYYEEGWQEHVRGGPSPEQQRAAAWMAGAELKSPKVWAAIEWTDLIIEEYQLMRNGQWSILRSIGGHADLGVWLLDDWQALVRWEWIDPNTKDTKKTLDRSRYDQVAQWTVGVNYRIAPSALFMVNYVIPLEEGSRADIDAGKVGGKYQDVQNNYFRVQVQIRQ